MKTITIHYWRSPIAGIKYRQGEQKTYITRALTGIIKHVTSKDCSLMIRPTNDGIDVFIDTHRFGQK
jgi:hypothetical protein